MSATNLSKEILYKIFKHLTHSGIKECSQVCKAWYPAANLFLVETVTLPNRAAVIRYLETVENNSHHSDLNAVKTLVLGTYFRDQTMLKTQELETLLTNLPPRLRNLQFNDALIPVQELLQRCNLIIDNSTQLESLHLRFLTVKDLCFDVLYQFRNVLTKLTLNGYPKIHTFNQYGGVVEYISDFTNLQELCIDLSEFPIELEHVLTIFDRLDHLKSIDCRFKTKIPDNLIENHLASLTEREIDQLLNRLARLEKLSINVSYISNSIVRFITEFLLCLNSLKLCQYDLHDWNFDLFCNNLLNFACHLHDFDIFIGHVSPREVLDDDLGEIIDKVFDQIPDNTNCVERELQLRIPSREDQGSHMWSDDDDDDEDSLDRLKMYDLSLWSESLGDGSIKRTVSVSTGRYDPITEILPFDTVNTFAMFTWDTAYRCVPLDRDAITEVLDQLPSVTKVILGVPMDKAMYKVKHRVYPLVTHFEYLYVRYGAMDGLKECLAMFPNMKYLKLHYLIGTHGRSDITCRWPDWENHWEKYWSNVDENESRIQLEDLVVDTLCLDLDMMDKFSEKLFIIDVKCVKNNKRQLYMTSSHRLAISTITEEQLESLTAGKECIRVALTVGDIGALTLTMESYKEREKDEIRLSFV